MITMMRSDLKGVFSPRDGGVNATVELALDFSL